MRWGISAGFWGALVAAAPGASCNSQLAKDVPLSSCTVGGKIVLAREHNPDNLNQCCLPSLNPVGWSDWFQDGGQIVLGDGGEGWFGLGDLNGDGRQDLFYSGFDDGDGDPGGGPQLGVLVHVDSSEGFDALPVSYPYAAQAASGLYGFAVDLNGDGYDDLLLSSLGCCAVVPDAEVLLNLRNGTFGPPIPLPDTTTLWALIPGDANGDGIPDLFSTGYADAGPELRIGRGDGTFDPPVYLDTGFDHQVGEIGVGSLRGNGILDLVAVNQDDGDAGLQVSVMLGDGKGGFAPPVFYAPGLTGSWGYVFQLTDFDADGLMDLVVSDWPSGGISESGGSKLAVLHGNGDGTFGSLGELVLDPAALESSAQPANLQGKRSDDLIGASVVLSDAGLYGVTGVTNIYWRLEDGGLSAPMPLGTPSPYATAYLLTDVDGDGTQDILVVPDILGPTVAQVYLNACGTPSK